jgi:predicted acylesterase/phospholipase RssA
MGGAWMLGCLRALATKTGWDPRRADHLVGTSVGALVAGAASRLYLPSWMRGQQLPEAVAASCAIPAIYRPERIRDRRYVDGGLYLCSNLDLLAERQLDLVICLNPMSSPGVANRPSQSTRSRDRSGAAGGPSSPGT